MQHLQIKRPLVIFDLESTGVDVTKDRIVQIAMVRVEPLGLRRSFESLVNPQMPIPAGASKVHGIYDEDVKDQPTLKELAGAIHEMLEGADLAGFNSLRFDLPMLTEELTRVGQPYDASAAAHIDVMRIFHKMEPRDLTAAYRFYCDKELEGAHSAIVDTEATLEILDAQVARYPDIPRNVAELARFADPDGDNFIDATRKLMWTTDGEAALAFGKNKGRTLRELAMQGGGYLNWMVGADFSDEVKQILIAALQGNFPKR